MKLSTSLLVLATALGLSSAHPHLHSHVHLHEKRALLTHVSPSSDAPAVAAGPVLEGRARRFLKSGKKKPAAAPAPPVVAIPTPTPAAAFKPFCGGAASKRATAEQIAYKGNTGTAGNWGCNMMLIDGGAASLYDYTAKFSSVGGSGTWSCACFNKIGPTNLIDGFWHSAVSFTLAPGAVQHVAFDSNSQGGCACGPGGSPPKTSWGQFAGTWLEFDMGNTANGGNSGADASVLVAGSNGLPYYGMSVAANGNVCSWVKSDGRNMEAYMPGMEDLDGVGCKGYYKNHLDVILGD